MYIAHIWCMYHVSFGRGCAAPTLRTQPMAQSCTDLNITIYNEMHLKPTMFYIQYYPAAKVEKQSLQPIIIYNHVCWCGLVETYHTALHCNKCEIVMTTIENPDVCIHHSESLRCSRWQARQSIQSCLVQRLSRPQKIHAQLSVDLYDIQKWRSLKYITHDNIITT